MMLNCFLNGQSLCIFIDTPANGLHELSFSPQITYICYHVLVFVYFVQMYTIWLFINCIFLIPRLFGFSSDFYLRFVNNRLVYACVQHNS